MEVKVMVKAMGKAGERNAALRIHRDGREVCLDTAAGRREYARRRRMAVAAQQNRCAICRAWLDEDEAVTDHVRPRGMGAGFRDDRAENIRAVHLWCNSLRGSRRGAAEGAR